MTEATNYTIDITGLVCPMTFVRVKLLIERMSSGETVEIRLQGKEPVENVPKSIVELGHQIISVSREDETLPWGPQRLLIRKK